ncbi:MAG: GAF domain-containing protein, partial [Acidobacteria bacterium]|nr:GAF domain-containing protein [Acidobacteriota bacterium]
VGQAWSHWLSRGEIEEENSALQRFVTSIGELNRFVLQQVTRERPDERGIFRRALEATSAVIQTAEITDVRLLNEESHELYFEETQGAAWDSGTAEEVRARQARKFSILERPPTSGGARVVQTEQVYAIPDVSNPGCLDLETFPDTRRMIIAPIGIAGKIFGVLDIRGTGDREFSRHAVPFAEFLGQQLGLYQYLMKTIGQLQRLPRVQAQTFEDFTHQLKSPILQVHARARTCLQLGATASIGAGMQSHLLALRGLASKAKRVSQSLRLFADLAREQALTPQLKPLEESSLVKMLIESTIDQRSTLLPSRALSLHVATESFDTLSRHSVEADPDLLFQAVNNLLDNAVKYSYPRTTVRVEGGITGTGRFHISVTNTGLPIKAAEARLCTERAWRSESAKDVTGEGSGIGLWIVKHIMDAHGGELMVVPTTRENVTEVKLLFPTGRAKKQEPGR